MSNGLGGDAFTRNVMDGRTDGRTDRRTMDQLWYEINIPVFSKEKSGYNNGCDKTEHLYHCFFYTMLKLSSKLKKKSYMLLINRVLYLVIKFF